MNIGTEHPAITIEPLEVPAVVVLPEAPSPDPEPILEPEPVLSYMVVPDGIDPVVGWRAWVLHDSGFLVSLSGAVPWVPHEPIEAIDARSWEGWKWTTRLTYIEGPCPHEDYTCGIYAVDEMEIIPVFSKDINVVIWQVYLWGKVIPGDRGWRAQYAYPKEFHLLRGQEKIIQDYGVPLVWREQTSLRGRLWNPLSKVS